MRLGQMARKLSVSPSAIVQFLASQNITLDENANSKLEEQHIALIFERFGQQDSFPAGDNMNVFPESLVMSEQPQPEEIPAAQEFTTMGLLESDSIGEVIKVPKISLSGLKVVGKIELPDAKNKEASQPDSVQGTSDEKPVKVSQNKKPPREFRTPKNPIAIQREKEMMEELEKRKEQAARDKERKTKNYLKRVKMSPPTKAVRLIDEPVMEMTADELKKEPTSWFGKLIRWLRT